MEYIGNTEFRSLSIRKYLKKNKSKSKWTDPNDYANDIQEDPNDSECYVEVKNIYKFYKFRTFGTNRDENDKKLGKIFAANNNISFKVYNNEIFAILGHNGAGKSTLIQNMVGIINPDRGETYYGGLPFSKNKKKIYGQFGICLQSNVIIKGFTVADHFKFYSGIKGIDDSEESLQKWLEEIDLVEKRDYLVEKLSGGQKRKLCIGLALTGNPKYVFLDEPTTGLDPLSRRKIWDLLLKVKKDRIIFITTHYMDEADIIADRKLILTHGVIRCLGSSIYLKNHFQMKYNLEVETSSPKKVNDLIHRVIPSAQFCDNLIETKNDTINGISSPHSQSHSQSSISISNTEINDSSSTISFTTQSSLVSHSITNSETRLTIDKPNHDSQIPSQYQYRDYYTWKLPITSASLFSYLLKDMENARGSILSDFSLNEPMLEELFVDLENETEVKKNPENTKNIKDILQIKNVKRPGMMNTALRLCRYRFLRYFRQTNYLIMDIVIPLCLMAFLLPVIKNNFDSRTFKALGTRDMSAKNFNHQQWNYEVENSDGSISNDIIKQEINSGGDIFYMNHEEMIKTNRAIYNPPYFVSSFSINFTEQGIYDLNIYNNRYLAHSLPSTLNVLSNAVLAANQVNETINTYFKPITYFKLLELNDSKIFATVVFVICISFPLSFYGTNVVRERLQNLHKQLQLNGVSNRSYWFSILFSDYIMLIITCILIGGVVVILNFTPLLYINTTILLALFTIFGTIGCLLLQYCFSFCLKSENSAFIIFFFLNIVPTCCIFLNVYNNHITVDFNTGDTSISIYMGVLCLFLTVLFPNFGIARTFRSMIHAGLSHDILDTSISFLKLLQPDNLVIFCLVGEIGSICVYSFIFKRIIRKVYNHKSGVFETPEKIEEQYMKELKEGDEDIYSEYKRVCNNEGFPIRMIKLSKEYSDLDLSVEEINDAIKRDHPSKYGEFHMSDKGSRRIVMSAFDNISIGVDKQECFGILGPNGSGKTSLLNTASFSFPQTLGKIYYDGKDTTERQDNEITLGYCPQEDTLWEEYTLLEHIEMFLYIRGYSRKQAKRIAKEFIDYCRLTEHKNKMPSELSGGTRRKLNLLIALCCSSSKIIMDEPTAGMDPSTRRYVWDIINSNVRFNNSSNIISTHSMEEAELLCDRIAIMVNGKIRCIGSPKYLKMKFGNTYILEVHTNNIEKFHQEVVIGRNLFEDNEYDQEFKSLQRIKYEVRGKCNIGRVFDIMESCRKSNLFTDYNYSQTSLEQIFMNIVYKYKGKEEE